MDILTTIQKNGRILLPARMRRSLQIEAGDPVVLRLEQGVLQVIPLRSAVRMAQQSVQRYLTPGESLVEALISERRAEAEHE